MITGLEGCNVLHGNTYAPHLHSMVTACWFLCMDWGGIGLCEALAVWAACVCVFRAGGA